MTNEERYKLWADFLKSWPPERVHDMALEEYTNDERNDAFVYWLESRLQDIGSIWGGTAFKFGIYRRSNTDSASTAIGGMQDSEYGWYKKYGTTRDAAWQKVKATVVSVVDAAQAGDIEQVDDIDFSPAVKWKIAFLYQPEDDRVVFPVFKKDALYQSYKVRVSGSVQKSTATYSAMYAALSDAMPDADLLDRAGEVWSAWESSKQSEQRFWLVPLTDSLGFPDDVQRKAFCRLVDVASADVPDALRNDMLKQEISSEDRIALWHDGRVRARGVVGTAEKEEINWRQERCEITPSLPSVPQYEIAEIKTIPQAIQIWGPVLTETPLPPGAGVPSEAVQPDVTPDQPGEPCPPPTNLILFGPPGTGKTYHTVGRALELCGIPVPEDRDEAMKEYRKLRDAGRIETVTFHQSYSYEEFVEGIRPEVDEATGNVRYDCRDGILKQIAALASRSGTRRRAGYDFDPARISFWKMSLGNVNVAADAEVYDRCINEGCILLGYGLGLDFSACKNRDEVLEKLKEIESETKSTDYHVTSVNLFKNEMAIGDIVIVSDGNHKFRAIGKVTGPYRCSEPGGEYGQYRPVEWLAVFEGSLPRDLLFEKAISQMTLYRVDAGKLKLDALRELVSPVVKPERLPHVLIIDEINRGNISKVFGELITLMERDKRLGAQSELKVKLPYSQEPFGLPPNLHFLATMNTADRSIALMDVALRRRFTFEEMMPDPGVVKETLATREVSEELVRFVPHLLEVLNSRIRFLYDRDHQLGHSFFLDVTSFEDLRQVMLERVIPTLQEYFYGAWDKLCTVLGCPYDENATPARSDLGSARSSLLRPDGGYAHALVRAELLSETSVLLHDHDEYDNKIAYEVNSLFRNAAGSRLAAFFYAVSSDPDWLVKVEQASEEEAPAGGGTAQGESAT